MIRKEIGARSAVIITTCLTAIFFTSAKAHAQACENLFKADPKLALVETRSEKEELKEKISVDKLTKQKRVQSFVKIRNGRELWVDHLVAEPGKPTIVLLNGQTYEVPVWDAFVAQLKGDGLGILRYDPMGMGETMKKYGIPDAPFEITDQVKDLASLIDTRLGKNAKVHVLGLSYGGGEAILYGATHPNRIASLILEAPLTEPLPALESDIQMKIDLTRVWQPWNRATDAELHSFFLKQIVFLQFPMTEPSVLNHPWKLENVFRLAEGTGKFHASDYVDRLPAGKVHLMIGEKDQYIPAPILEKFWRSVPIAARASRLFIENSEHKIPEVMPHFSAEWVKLIIAGDPQLTGGATWTGGVYKGGAFSPGKKEIEISSTP